MCCSKYTFGLFGVHIQLEGGIFEPMLSNFGPSRDQKCLENVPIWDHRWLKNGSKPWFFKNDPSRGVVPKTDEYSPF